MTCWHFRLHRKFVPYLEGELQPKDVNKLEKHLLDCEACRAVLLRLRAGHQLAQELRQFRPQAEHPEFEAVMAAAGRTGFSHRDRSLAWESWLDGLATPRVVEVLTLLVVVQLALLVFSNRTVLFGARHGITVKPTALSWSEFHQLSIPELKSNTQPHIATEGFVSDVHADEEEGTVQFKLVQNSQGSGPFVICEIMSSQMEVPREGSYVRVYGVARYDAQTDRKWYEVNPVLNIAPVKH
jgi:hypothetical protein